MFFFGGFLNQTSAHVALTRDSSRLTHAQNTHTHHTYTHTKIRIRIGQKPKYTDSQSQKKTRMGSTEDAKVNETSKLRLI